MRSRRRGSHIIGRTVNQLPSLIIRPVEIVNITISLFRRRFGHRLPGSKFHVHSPSSNNSALGNIYKRLSDYLNPIEIKSNYGECLWSVLKSVLCQPYYTNSIPTRSIYAITKNTDQLCFTLLLLRQPHL